MQREMRDVWLRELGLSLGSWRKRRNPCVYPPVRVVRDGERERDRERGGDIERGMKND